MRGRGNKTVCVEREKERGSVRGEKGEKGDVNIKRLVYPLFCLLLLFFLEEESKIQKRKRMERRRKGILQQQEGLVGCVWGGRSVHLLGARAQQQEANGSSSEQTKDKKEEDRERGRGSGKRRRERGEIKFLVRGTSKRFLHIKSTRRHKTKQASNQHTQKEEAILGQKQQSKNQMGSFFLFLSSSIYLHAAH